MLFRSAADVVVPGGLLVLEIDARRAEVEAIVKDYLAQNPEAVQRIVKDYLAKKPDVIQDALAEMIAAASFNTDAMRVAADAPAAVATDIAEWLVARGMPFRQAHAKVGELVSRSLAGNTPLVDLVRADADLGADAAALFAPGVAVQRRASHGAAGPLAAIAQRDELRRTVAALVARLA